MNRSGSFKPGKSRATTLRGVRLTVPVLANSNPRRPEFVLAAVWNKRQ